MTETTRPSWLPSIGDILFLLVLYLLLGLLPDFIFGDGSTGWHFVAGQYILEHGRVPTVDLVSYTFASKEWVAYEWLFDAFIAGLEKIGGLRLVSVACCSAISFMFLLLYRDCRRAGCHYGLTLVLCIMGAFVSAIHWLARPHLVTWFGVYLFAKLLSDFYHERISAGKLWLFLALTMLIWVNCHPAFLMGFAILFIYWFCDLFAWAGMAASEARTKCGTRLKALTISGAIVGAVSLINPYGFKLYQYIFQYLKQSTVISQTDEFASPVFHGQLQPTCLELLFFALVTGLVVSKVKPVLPQFMTVLAYVHLALAGVRNMPLFVIVALPFIGELWGRNSSLANLLGTVGLAPPKVLAFVRDLVRTNAATFDQVEAICNRHALPALAVVLLSLSCLQGGKLLGTELVRSKFSPLTKPTETLDVIEKERLDPKRGFNYDNWGGYIRYKTGERVFIDDRVDFYGEKFYLDYADMAMAHQNWKQLMDKYKIQWVLFPKNGVIIAKLKQDADWKLLAEDQGSALYVRREEGVAPAGAAVAAPPSCAPGSSD